MSTPTIFNDDRGKVWVQMNGRTLRTWFYESRLGELAAMNAATEFVNGWKAHGSVPTEMEKMS